MLRLTNCHLCDKGIIVPNTDLFIDTKSGKIVDGPDSFYNVQTIDLKGKIVAPGYIDIQNNGIYGLNFSALNENSTDADVAEFRAFYKDVMAKYLKTGVTSLCPTVTSSFPEVYQKVLPIYKKSRSSAMCDSLGAHVEGPFINKKKKGCHPEETFVDAQSHDLSDVYGAANLMENVAIVTAAPDIPGVLELIPELVQSTDVVFSIGHTASDYATALKAVDSGASMVTHLYNAMPQPHHRDVGVVGLVTSPQAGARAPYFGLICDGVHVAPAMCVLAYRASPDKCILTTDAMHLIGLPDGTYVWDNQRIVKKGAILYLVGTTTLAGAATDLSVCVQNLKKWANISLAEAVKTVTNNAADSLRIKHKGYLDAGCDADLVVLDDEGNVEQVFKLGVVAATESRLTASL